MIENQEEKTPDRLLDDQTADDLHKEISQLRQEVQLLKIRKVRLEEFVVFVVARAEAMAELLPDVPGYVLTLILDLRQAAVKVLNRASKRKEDQQDGQREEAPGTES